MSTKTEIEWADSTWSPLRFRVKADAGAIAEQKGYRSLVQIARKMAGRVGPHCEHVSPGCENCYAETNNHRCLPANGTGLPYDRRARDLVDPFIDEKILLQPLKWGPIKTFDGLLSRNLPAQFRPRRIFVENQSDIFGEWVTDEMLDRIFAVMALCRQHIFQVLTKRPQRMLKYVSKAQDQVWDCMRRVPHRPVIRVGAAPLEWPLRNVWLGVSCENQAAADERIPLLLQTPAAVRFISAEPLLGAIDMASVKRPDEFHRSPYGWHHWWPKKLHWVIVGGESGPGARPMHLDWARSLRDQCSAASTAFFMKQMGSVYGPNKGHDLPSDLDIRQFPEAPMTATLLQIGHGAGFDQRGRWHRAAAEERFDGRHPLRAAQGTLNGLVISSGMWAVIIALWRLL